jgi:hypothetical protein
VNVFIDKIDVAICLEGEDMASEIFLWIREIKKKKGIDFNSIFFKQNITFDNNRKPKSPKGVNWTASFKEKPNDDPKISSNTIQKDKNSKTSFTIYY